MSEHKIGTMLVRVYYNGSTEGDVVTWNDRWPISLAMTDWLTGAEWFEILAYYPKGEGMSLEPMEQNFIKAEERHASCSSD